MLMTVEEAMDYAHIMTEESYRETIANKRETWQETDCIPARAKKNHGDTKKGDLLTNINGNRQARDALSATDGAPTSGRNLCCHLCPNDSMAHHGFICINPNHLYWGSVKDNFLDKSPQARAALWKASASAHLQVTCPHCGKTGQQWAMSRWHFDNCNCKDKKMTN